MRYAELLLFLPFLWREILSFPITLTGGDILAAAPTVVQEIYSILMYWVCSLGDCVGLLPRCRMDLKRTIVWLCIFGETKQNDQLLVIAPTLIGFYIILISFPRRTPCSLFTSLKRRERQGIPFYRNFLVGNIGDVKYSAFDLDAVPSFSNASSIRGILILHMLCDRTRLRVACFKKWSTIDDI